LRIRFIREFIKLESAGGIILFAVAIFALLLDNSPFAEIYQEFLQIPVVVQLGAFKLAKPLILWINDGLMAVFFLLVGLEIKREIFEGELDSWNKISLPAIAAVGGMIVPAVIYSVFNLSDSMALRGWAIPTATDIAFALGIMALLGSRVPVSLKIFLTAIAIFDDIGAIAIIAMFYTYKISFTFIGLAVFTLLVLFLLNRLRVSKISPYILIGLLLWVFVLKSGIHATLAGVALAFAIPLTDKKRPFRSPLRDLEHSLHKWVAFGVLPIFAFANAGVSFAGLDTDHVFGGISIGIAMGLFFGKQIGVFLASWLAIHFGLARMPHGTNWLGVYGVALICGVGFTMSLFIGTLAFYEGDASFPVMVRVGVLMGSFASGILGYLVLRYASCRPRKSHKALS